VAAESSPGYRGFARCSAEAIAKLGPKQVMREARLQEVQARFLVLVDRARPLAAKQADEAALAPVYIFGIVKPICSVRIDQMGVLRRRSFLQQWSILTRFWRRLANTMKGFGSMLRRRRFFSRVGHGRYLQQQIRQLV
jgi:hypothetical protein